MAVDQSSTTNGPAYNPTNLIEYVNFKPWLKVGFARQLVAGSMALLNMEEDSGSEYDPSAEVDRKDCAMNLLLQAFEVLSDAEEAHHVLICV